MKRKNVILKFLLLLPLCSCSIKEDRSGCPCYLMFPEYAFDTGGYDGDVMLYVFENLMVHNGVYPENVLRNPATEIAIPRGYASVTGIGGVSGMRFESENVLVIPEGHDCDPLFSFVSDTDATGETAVVGGRMAKDYASLTIVVRDLQETADSYRLRVVGKVSGVDIRNMRPVQGPFVFEPEMTRDGQLWSGVSRLPRQSDDSLILELLPSDPASDAGDIAVVQIGRIIDEALEYDWRADSLDDIYLEIDYSRSCAVIGVMDWELNEMIEVSI